MSEVSAEIPNLDSLVIVDNKELEIYGMEILSLYPQLAGFFIGNEQGDFLFIKRFPDGSIGTEIINRSISEPTTTWFYRDLAGKVDSVEVTNDVSYDPRSRPWYIGAKDSGEQFWTDIYIFFTDRQPGITSSNPIYDANGSLIGVVGIDITLNELSRFLETLQVGKSGIVFITNAEGEVVAFPNLEISTQEGDSFRPLSITEIDIDPITAVYSKYLANGEEQFTLETDQGRYMTAFTPFPDNFQKNWEIGITVPEDDFIGSIKETNRISLLFSLVILLIAILLVIFFSRNIARPIELLTEETERIKNLQLDSNLRVESSIHEVQRLADSISSMRNSLEIFKKHAPAVLVRQLITVGEETQLGGRERQLTLLFTDVAGFTSISQDMIPEDLMRQLSAYMGIFTEIIMTFNGIIDKYMGDGLLAYWDAPIAKPDHACLACKTALECRDRANELNQDWQAKGNMIFPTRIAIHTGETLVGNLGSSDYMSYTVLGKSVDFIRLLKPVQDRFESQIVISDSTYKNVADTYYTRPLESIADNKHETTIIYELICERDQAQADDVALSEQFTQGFEAYMNHDWTKAHDIFFALVTKYPHDTASQLYFSWSLANLQDSISQ